MVALGGLGTRVTVLGAGSWGTPLASLLAARHPTLLWARRPEIAAEVRARQRNELYLKGLRLDARLGATSDLREAVSQADIVFVAVPVQGFREVLEQASAHLRPWIPVVSLAKGLEQHSWLRMTEVIRAVLPGHTAAALTGPNIAREILEGKAAAAVVAAEDLERAGEIQKVVRSGLFRVYLNHDVVGCEIGGALKNVVAIAAGIGEGLGVGDNTRAAVMARGLAELTRLGVAMGAEQATFAGLAGMGDLVATCMSPHSRNRFVGEQLGRGRRLGEIERQLPMVAEGVRTAGLVLDLAERHGLDLPICRVIHQVVAGEISPMDAYLGLTPPGHEADPG